MAAIALAAASPAARAADAPRGEAGNVALGASIFLLGLDLDVLNKVIADVFAKKGVEIINQNQSAARAGFDYLKKNANQLHQTKNQPQPNLYTATGNEAIGLGAIAGGLQFYVAYPMTPASSVLHFLANHAKKGNFLVKHAEDDLTGYRYHGEKGTGAGGF